ncbi:hypothetical protein CPI83_29815 (plasmid) [Rhodococcus sp. H-CA8f]|uniref:hypothetical protein n=1 Tax=Rhodococcus sp. H-CA8f TaxID=1727214 RepID=UPI000BE2B3F3|nr:hypothetical protein [Rhodococcus sp. H-CA8f]ATI36397.1 hypothetical protein CPI83_29815 [Rhodococcus sp. H-CA8f]
MTTKGKGVRSWILFVLGIVVLAGAYGAFSAFGIGYTSAELCIVKALEDMSGSGTTEPLAEATRLWLPVVGASCTWAPADDVRIVQYVFDTPASVFAVAGWTMIAASVFSRRSASRVI